VLTRARGPFKRRPRLVSAVLVAVGVGCRDARLPSFDHSGLKPWLMRGHSVRINGSLYVPGTVTVTPEFVVIGDGGADSALRFLVRSGPGDGRFFSVGRVGDGPGEFRQVGRIWKDMSKPSTALWVFDPVLRRLTRIPVGQGGSRLTSALSGHEPVWDSIVTVEAASGVRDAVWLTDSSIVGVTLSPVTGRLAFFDSHGRVERVSGAFPPVSGVPAQILTQVYQGPLLVSRGRDRIVVATRFSGLLDLYDGHGKLVKSARGPFAFKPVYHMVPGSKSRGTGPTAAATIDQRLGYLGLTEYDGHILALFSGRRLGDYPKNANFGDQIHVFDWELRFQCALTLSQEVLSIDADDSGALYGIQYEPSPSLVRFELGGDVCGPGSRVRGVAFR